MYTKVIELYKLHFGAEPTVVEPITGAGSNRLYVRLGGDETVVGVVGNNLLENEAFIYESGHFADRGFNVPRVIAVSADRMAYLQEDLGRLSLYDLIKDEGSDSPEVIMLCKKALKELALMQQAVDGFDWSKCFPVRELDERAIMWDLNYFKYCFLKVMSIEIDEVRLEEEFHKLTDVILGIGPKGFMFRDFQSRNIMIKDGEAYFIDFQGGRKGPGVYDAVSFIWQARAGFSEEDKKTLIDYYIRESNTFAETDTEKLDCVVLFRMLQVLGAYGLRGRVEGKPAFIRQIPMAVRTALKHINKHEFPAICSCLEEALEAATESKPEYDNSRLTVKVSSFSYKKGIPGDDSGNGGGFVFDCRGIHNPGRYEPYKALTGNDRPVIEFLEKESDIEQFLKYCYELVDATVEVYMRRGFTSLMVSFGCTGGQHRSVYSATHMARHLNEKYGIKVVLDHIEQKHKEVFELRQEAE